MNVEDKMLIICCTLTNKQNQSNIDGYYKYIRLNPIHALQFEHGTIFYFYMR